MSPWFCLDLFDDGDPDFLIIELLSDNAPTRMGFANGDLVVETVPAVTAGDRLSARSSDVRSLNRHALTRRCTPGAINLVCLCC